MDREQTLIATALLALKLGGAVVVILALLLLISLVED